MSGVLWGVTIDHWSKIPGFSGYCVSRYGEIYSLKSKKLLQPQFTYNGYLTIKLINDVGKRLKKRIHRLVLETFRPLPNDLNMEIDHYNNVRHDNREENLIWVTRKGNIAKMKKRVKELKALYETN